MSPYLSRAIVFLTAIVLAIVSGPRSAGRDPPNVLLIIADDVGVSNIGAYTSGPNAVPGNPPPTPNIDALADYRWLPTIQR